MMIHDVTSKAGAHKRRTRVGRGEGSGHGKTSGRGTKGQGARAGYERRVGYIGGAEPLFRRLPKFGFSNAKFTERYDVVNLAELEKHFDAGSTVDAATLKAKGLLTPKNGRLKILGTGELTKALTVHADAISASAKEKIEKAGGSVTISAKRVYRPKGVKKAKNESAAKAK